MTPFLFILKHQTKNHVKYFATENFTCRPFDRAEKYKALQNDALKNETKITELLESREQLSNMISELQKENESLRETLDQALDVGTKLWEELLEFQIAGRTNDSNHKTTDTPDDFYISSSDDEDDDDGLYHIHKNYRGEI